MSKVPPPEIAFKSSVDEEVVAGAAVVVVVAVVAVVITLPDAAGTASPVAVAGVPLFQPVEGVPRAFISMVLEAAGVAAE